jgi:RND family efflux transporter MFP subunit
MEASMRFTWRSTWLIFPILCVACSRPPEIPEESPRVPVKLETVERVSFQPTLTLLGVVRPAGEAQVVIPVAGRLRYPERFRDGLSSGVQVRAGEVLARVDNQEAEQSLAESRLRLEASSRELERYQKAFDSGVVSAAQLAQYKAEADLAGQRVTAARQRRSSLDLRSPVSGWLLVERRLPPEGEVQAGTALARVAAGGAPKIEARAAAGDRARLHEGLTARFAVAGSKETAGRGVVREIAPMVDAGGTIAVVAEVTAGDALPPPGEGVEVQVELDRREQTMTVPEEALLVSEGGAAVFVAEGGEARRRTVTTGGRAGGRVEVLTGLSPGDKVVVEGASLLSDGTRLTPIQEPAGASPKGSR